MLSFRLCGAFPLPDRLETHSGPLRLGTGSGGLLLHDRQGDVLTRKVAQLQLEAEAGQAATKLGGVPAALIQEPETLLPFLLEEEARRLPG